MKKFLATTFFILLSLIFATNVKADSQFKSTVITTYQILSNGDTTVTTNVNLTNLTTDVYASSYTFIMQNIEPINPKAFEGTVSVPIDVQKNGIDTEIKLNFPDNIVGKDKTRNFTISFSEKDVATKTGEVWEVYIPKLASADSFDSYSLTVEAPKSLGSLAYISPDPTTTYDDAQNNYYTFNKDELTKTNITLGFGEFQIFQFNLTYQLENPLSKPSFESIAIPADTSSQKVFYTKLDPKPENISVDDDGNWIAVYKLNPRQQINVSTTGDVQIFSGSRPFLRPNDALLNVYLKPQKYWEVDDSQISELAKSLKTPEAIYNYVESKLKYNFARVAPNVERLGAKNILNNPTNAICMEFTDLFVALARAAGIPAREIEGYAYTNDPQTEPLSLVADVLHAWPEYWDSSKNEWISVDPTWGETSGIDFFHKFDLRHFAFVTHGVSSTLPYPPGSYKLGTNPQKDVFVDFGNLPQTKQGVIKLNVVSNKNLPFFPKEFQVSVVNPGPTAIYNLDPQVYFDGKLSEDHKITVLPPFASFNFNLTIPFSFFGNNTPKTIKITADTESAEFATSRFPEILLTLIFFSTLTICLIIILLVRLKGAVIKAFFTNLYGKIFKKPKKVSEESENSQKPS